MAEHIAVIRWRNGGPDFPGGKYSRLHTWEFDGGVQVRGSAAPSVVPAPWSDPTAVDPEEALVAAIASCHMLTFLYLAGKAGLVVESYDDRAVGYLTKQPGGVPWVSRAELRPRIRFSGREPSAEELAELHHKAHEQCFIAQSVKTEIVVLEPLAEEEAEESSLEA